MASLKSDKRHYQVVINHAEPYSIWLADRDIPRGWRATGTKEKRLNSIEVIWTDMRPLSFRKGAPRSRCPSTSRHPVGKPRVVRAHTTPAERIRQRRKRTAVLARVQSPGGSVQPPGTRCPDR